MKATLKGKFQKLNQCYIKANNKLLVMKVLPDISDQKTANYSEETGIGRSAPLKIFSHGDSRSINWQVHFIAESSEESIKNLEDLRFIESLVYPDQGTGQILMKPPPIATIQCGQLLSDGPLCAILKSYSVKFPTDCMWDEDTYMPMKFDVDLVFEIVYETYNLPGTQRILEIGG